MRIVAIIVLAFTLQVNAQVKNELRAVWLTNVDSYVMFNDVSIADAMDYLAGLGFNVVFPVVWNKGYTLYPSSIMDSMFSVPIWQPFAGRDPLEKIIMEGHRAGLEVIPWFEFGFSPSYSLNGGHIIAAKPHWAAKNNQGQLVVKNGFDWMAGTNPEVQDFLISLSSEVIDKYDVDGVQGDDRLPAMPIEGGYDSVTVEIYKAEHSGNLPPSNAYNLPWKKWRGDKLNAFLGRWRDSVKVRGEQFILSIAPSVFPWGYDNYLQDSRGWMDSNYVDNFIPQLYRDNIISYRFELGQALTYIQPGQINTFFAGVLSKAGSYVMSSQLLKESIAENRLKGVAGESFFFYEAFKENNGLLGDTIKNIYQGLAIPPYRNGNHWRPKAQIINEDDSLRTVRIGDWQRVAVQGYKPGIYWTNSADYASFEYYYDVEFPAWYHVYAYQVPNFVFTENAVYTLYSDNDSTQVVVSQRNTANTRWVKIGDVYLTPGRKKAVKVDNSQLEAGKYLLADATFTMINRKLSPDVVVTGINEEKSDLENIPSEFLLYQNYPNPFNPETVISFSIPKSSNIKIKVYDILGHQIAELYNGYLQSGTHQLNFDAGKYQLSSGVYFYRLESESVNLINKMIYLK
ncbi:MAG: family 10 glycosylhydrolase [Ignavibacteriaceae bacterium]|nr:family 10 glycosylhydrolase [Ignavibacteriaceae bacterium]